ncbi:hypothetical protein [Bacillus sp. FJAT-47783]|uniref:hypothetical protein n=1 Tax=Bacillus sp. FJAT-47783 TaxID=2922712 RepID=UPI001FAC2A09|nr:hypothetical protein [Bacillus sp. FJAT-47783]
MKQIIGTTIIASSLLLSACSSDKESKIESKESVAHAVENTENNKSKKDIVDEKAWKDATKLNEEMKYDFSTNAKDYIAEVNRIFHDTPDEDSKLIQSGHDEGYYYYLEAMSLDNGLDIIQVEGISLKKDFDNLRKLVGIIIEEHDNRTAHIDPEEYWENKREASKDWKAPSERMIQAIKYTKQLLNDVDIAINNKGKGKTFGVAHQMDGQKTIELETFIFGEAENVTKISELEYPYKEIAKHIANWELPSKGIVSSDNDNIVRYENGYGFMKDTGSLIERIHSNTDAPQKPTTEQFIGVIMGLVSDIADKPSNEFDAESNSDFFVDDIEHKLRRLNEMKQYTNGFKPLEEWIDETLMLFTFAKESKYGDKRWELYNKGMKKVEKMQDTIEIAQS